MRIHPSLSAAHSLLPPVTQKGLSLHLDIFRYVQVSIHVMFYFIFPVYKDSGVVMILHFPT